MSVRGSVQGICYVKPVTLTKRCVAHRDVWEIEIIQLLWWAITNTLKCCSDPGLMFMIVFVVLSPAPRKLLNNKTLWILMAAI